MPNNISPEVEATLILAAANALVTYEKMARLVVRLHGEAAALTPGEIAAFLGSRLRGSSHLNQLGRDAEVAEWLRQNKTFGSLKQVRTACIERFGPDRVPSQATTSAFLLNAGRSGRRGDETFLSDKPDVVKWLRGTHDSRTITQLRQECAARFGQNLTPSRSSLQRFIKGEAGTDRIRRNGLWADPEVGAWLKEHAPLLRMADLHAQCVERFGAERARSLSAMQRFLAAQKGRRLTRKKSRAEIAAGLVEMERRKAELDTPDEVV